MPKPLYRLKSKLTIENLWVYVVASLMVKPTYAYNVKKLINELFGFNPTTITLYSVVYRLKRSGLIREEISSGEKIYRPTEEGIKELKDAIAFMDELVNRLKKVTSSEAKQA